jgi:hypothetical protein
MEDVLDVYKRPYDPRFPVVGLDEKPAWTRSRPGREAGLDEKPAWTRSRCKDGINTLAVVITQQIELSGRSGGWRAT